MRFITSAPVPWLHMIGTSPGHYPTVITWPETLHGTSDHRLFEIFPALHQPLLAPFL